jgi:putative oxidoreductase
MAKGNSLAGLWAPRVLSVLRIVSALVYMEHGTQKLFGFPGGQRLGNFDPLSLLGMAGILETFGGTLLALGLFTRPVAFILSGQMAVAYFKMHAPKSIWPILNQGELAVLFCFLFLYFAAAGGGPFSIDAMRRRR